MKQSRSNLKNLSFLPSLPLHSSPSNSRSTSYSYTQISTPRSNFQSSPRLLPSFSSFASPLLQNSDLPYSLYPLTPRPKGKARYGDLGAFMKTIAENNEPRKEDAERYTKRKRRYLMDKIEQGLILRIGGVQEGASVYVKFFGEIFNGIKKGIHLKGGTLPDITVTINTSKPVLVLDMDETLIHSEFCKKKEPKSISFTSENGIKYRVFISLN